MRDEKAQGGRSTESRRSPSRRRLFGRSWRHWFDVGSLHRPDQRRRRFRFKPAGTSDSVPPPFPNGLRHLGAPLSGNGHRLVRNQRTLRSESQLESRKQPCQRTGRRPGHDPQESVAVLSASERSTSELDLRQSRRADQRWRQQSFAGTSNDRESVPAERRCPNAAYSSCRP